MNFYTYLGITPERFASEYIDTGLVMRQLHATFPLDIYTYGRKATFENVWDSVTSKCRGIIVNRFTGENVARPFEKFHNYGSPQAANLYNPVTEADLKQEPYIWDKVDGFLCTMYRWEGIDYIASKGSFHSIHAKWATSWYRNHVGAVGVWPPGYTPVFEGLHRDLRIVVDYGSRQELVLLALINNETGAELSPVSLRIWADVNHVGVPADIDMTLERAREESLKEYRDGLGTDEGYVLTWYSPSGPPKRLKMKFVDYLRLHRMVCGVTPWRIWEALTQNHGQQIIEWLDRDNNTPWFSKFVRRWHTALVKARDLHREAAEALFKATVEKLGIRPSAETARIHDIRRAFAQEFTRPENKIYSTALFKMLDSQDPNPIFWKYVEGMTKGIAPCRDAQFS